MFAAANVYDALLELPAYVSLAAALAFLLLLALYASQRRDLMRLHAWMEREPGHPVADVQASEALLDRAEAELEAVLGTGQEAAAGAGAAEAEPALEPTVVAPPTRDRECPRQPRGGVVADAERDAGAGIGSGRGVDRLRAAASDAHRRATNQRRFTEPLATTESISTMPMICARPFAQLTGMVPTTYTVLCPSVNCQSLRLSGGGPNSGLVLLFSRQLPTRPRRPITLIGSTIFWVYEGFFSFLFLFL